MKQDNLLQRQHTMLNCLANLPRKMLLLHGADNITEFVLHDLCHENCFNLKKAAFFIDNPDFNHTKGVAGFSAQEALKTGALWHNPQEFSKHMQSSAFNQKVRSLSHASAAHMPELAQTLGFENYAHCRWAMKHDNHGFVLYEKADTQDSFADDHLLNGLSLLSFCPVF